MLSTRKAHLPWRNTCLAWQYRFIQNVRCLANCILQESLAMDHGCLEMKDWSLPALARGSVLEKIGVRSCCSRQGAAVGVEVPVGAQHGARSRGRPGRMCFCTALLCHASVGTLEVDIVSLCAGLGIGVRRGRQRLQHLSGLTQPLRIRKVVCCNA